MTSPGSAREETASLEDAPTRAGVGGQAKQEETVTGELVGLLAGGAETIPEKWGKGPGQGNEDKVLGQGWGGRLSLARCAEKEGGSGIQSNPKPARSPATICSLWLLQPLPTSKSLAQCPHPRPLAMAWSIHISTERNQGPLGGPNLESQSPPQPPRSSLQLIGAPL